MRFLLTVVDRTSRAGGMLRLKAQPFVMPPPLGDQSAPPGPSSVSQSVRPRTSLAAAVSTPPASDSQAPRTRTVRFQEPCPTVSNLDGTQGSQDMLLSESLERNLPVSMDLESLWIRIENFTGTRDDREHRYLDHCITEYLLALDGIDVQNHPELRESRRRAILKLYDLGNLLEQRCSLAPGAHQQPVTPPRGVSPLPISLQQAIMAPGNVDPLHVSQSSFRPSTIRPAHDRHSGGNSSSGSLAASLGLDASQAAQYERQSILNQQQAIIDQGLMAQQSALSQGHLAQNLLSAQPPISPPHAQLMWGTQDPRSLQSALTPTPEVDRSRVQSLCTRRDASLADQATPLLSSILGHSTTADPYAQAETPRLSLSGLGGSSGTVAGPRRRTDRASASAAAAFHRDLLHGAAHPGTTHHGTAHHGAPHPGTTHHGTTHRGTAPHAPYPASLPIPAASYPPLPAQPDLSIPIGLLIDRIQELQVQGRSGSAQARTKPVTLPQPKNSATGQISGLEFYRWLHLFIATIDRMGLSHPACHNELATNKYILPQELRTLAGEAADLRNALIKIQARFPPISSIYPELYREIQNVPRCSTNRQRVDRSGNLVASLGLMLDWFPGRDISREDVIYAVHRIEGETEGSVSLLNELNEIDRRQALPKNHPQHSSYIKSLIQRLDRLRQLWSELDAALSIAGRKAVVPSMSSFANEVMIKKKEKEDKGSSPPNPGGQNVQNVSKTSKTSKTSPEKADSSACKCFICRKPGEKKEPKEHAPWSCPSLPLIRSKQLTPPKILCLQCCKEKKEGKTHRPDCHVSSFQDKKTNADVKVDRSCQIHSNVEKGYVHQKLCMECGINLPPPKPKASVTSFAFSIEGRGSEITRCAFMTEVITIIGKDGKPLTAKVQYDSLGGGNFASGAPPGANHGDEGRLTEPFALNTLTGTHEYCLPLTLLLLDTPEAGKLWLDFMVTTFPDGGYIELDEMTRKRCDIYPYTEREINTCEVRLILGVAHSSYFPQPIASPSYLATRYPGLTLWRSRLSGKILFQGGFTPTAHPISSFFSMPAEVEDHHGELLQQPLTTPSTLASPPTAPIQ